MSAWDDVQTEPVKEVEAAIFRQMGDRSNSDPCSPWADLALALCQRISAAEAERDAARAEAEGLRRALGVAWLLRWTQVETDDWCEAVDEFDRLVPDDPLFPRAALASSTAPARETAPERFCNKCGAVYRGPPEHPGCSYFAATVHHHNLLPAAAPEQKDPNHEAKEIA